MFQKLINFTGPYYYFINNCKKKTLIKKEYEEIIFKIKLKTKEKFAKSEKKYEQVIIICKREDYYKKKTQVLGAENSSECEQF